jgi:hypothetical protein
VGTSMAAGISRASGGDNIDRDDIQGSEFVDFCLLFLLFWCLLPNGRKLEGSTTFRRFVLLQELHVLSIES